MPRSAAAELDRCIHAPFQNGMVIRGWGDPHILPTQCSQSLHSPIADPLHLVSYFARSVAFSRCVPLRFPTGGVLQCLSRIVMHLRAFMHLPTVSMLSWLRAKICGARQAGQTLLAPHISTALSSHWCYKLVDRYASSTRCRPDSSMGAPTSLSRPLGSPSTAPRQTLSRRRCFYLLATITLLLSTCD